MLRFWVVLAVITFTVPAASGKKKPAIIPNPPQSQHAVTPAAPITNNYYQQKGEEKPQGWWSLVSWPEGITTWAVLLTLGAITWQAWETRKAAVAALDNITMLKTKERARLAVAIEMEDFVEPNKWPIKDLFDLEVTFRISVENQGLTKAFEVAVFGAVMVTEQMFPPQLAEAEVYFISDIPRVMPQESTRYAGEIRNTKSFPKLDDAENISNGKAYMHLFGYVLYTDVFGERHKQPFRWLWVPHEEEMEGQLEDFGMWLPAPTTDEEAKV
jgi:hypothetical protein